jgi:hypothetical protein
MSKSDNYVFNTVPRTVLVLYVVGQTQCMKLLLEDIYDADKQLIVHGAYDLIIRLMALLTKQIVNGHNGAKCDALEETIKRRDVDIYLRGSDGIDIAVGRAQSELQASARQFTIATLFNIVKVHGFKAKRSNGDLPLPMRVHQMTVKMMRLSSSQGATIQNSLYEHVPPFRRLM